MAILRLFSVQNIWRVKRQIMLKGYLVSFSKSCKVIDMACLVKTLYWYERISTHKFLLRAFDVHIIIPGKRPQLLSSIFRGWWYLRSRSALCFNSISGACHYLTNRFQMEAPVVPSRSLREASVGMAEAFAKPSRSLLGGFSKPSAPATSSSSAREDVANPSRRRHGEPIAGMLHEGTVRASRSLREDFAKTFRQAGFKRSSRLLREGFAEPPRCLSGESPSRRLRGAVAATSLQRLHEPFIRSLRGPSRWWWVPRETRNPFEPRRTIFTARGSCGGWTQNATFRPLLLRRPPKKPIFGFGR